MIIDIVEISAGGAYDQPMTGAGFETTVAGPGKNSGPVEHYHTKEAPK